MRVIAAIHYQIHSLRPKPIQQEQEADFTGHSEVELRDKPEEPNQAPKSGSCAEGSLYLKFNSRR